jgi:hypothetical protein
LIVGALGYVRCTIRRWRPHDGGALILAIPAAVPPAAAELFVAAVLGLIGLNIHKTARDPSTPPAAGVLLDLILGLVAVTALVFFFSASLKVFF